MSETKSYEDVLEDDRVQEKNDVEDIPVLKMPFNVSPNYKGKNPKSPEELAKMYEERKAKREAKKYESDDKMVNHPSNYKVGKYEAIDIINEATKDLTGMAAVDTSQVLKYILRWNKKNGLQDCKKAAWYLNHLIEYLEAQK